MHPTVRAGKTECGIDSLAERAMSWWKKRASCLEETECPISTEAISSVIKMSGIKQEKAASKSSIKEATKQQAAPKKKCPSDDQVSHGSNDQASKHQCDQASK
jgi:hypothetical protein